MTTLRWIIGFFICDWVWAHTGSWILATIVCTIFVMIYNAIFLGDWSGNTQPNLDNKESQDDTKEVNQK